jgi:hypothetical protein
VSYTVTWRPTAERTLTKFWVESPERLQIAEAADEIDWRLKRDPAKQGESRWGATRILTVSPLSVYFDVSEDDKLLSVWAAWLSGYPFVLRNVIELSSGGLKRRQSEGGRGGAVVGGRESVILSDSTRKRG